MGAHAVAYIAKVVERTNRTSGVGLACREMAEAMCTNRGTATRWLRRLVAWRVIRPVGKWQQGSPEAARYDVAHPTRWRLPGGGQGAAVVDAAKGVYVSPLVSAAALCPLALDAARDALSIKGLGGTRTALLTVLRPGVRLSRGELADAITCHPKTVKRNLPMLVDLGLVTEHADGTYEVVVDEGQGWAPVARDLGVHGLTRRKKAVHAQQRKAYGDWVEGVRRRRRHRWRPLVSYDEHGRCLNTETGEIVELVAAERLGVPLPDEPPIEEPAATVADLFWRQVA